MATAPYTDSAGEITPRSRTLPLTAALWDGTHLAGIRTVSTRAMNLEKARALGAKMFPHPLDGDGLRCQLELPNYFIDFALSGGTLIVTFEGAGGPLERPNGKRTGWSHSFLAKNGYSTLCVKPKRLDWYRKPDLHRWLRSAELAQIFVHFDRVVFAGTSMGGYAAIAFSAILPGCDVMAFNPQATLAPEIAGWDDRFPAGSAQDWTGDFVDAASSVPSAGKIYLCYDPHDAPDAWHARHLDGENVIHLTTPFVGHAIPSHLLSMKILADVTLGCIEGTITPAQHWRLSRNRRSISRYFECLMERSRTARRQLLVLQKAVDQWLLSPLMLKRGLSLCKKTGDSDMFDRLMREAKSFHPASLEERKYLTDLFMTFGEPEAGIALAISSVRDYPRDYSAQHNLGKAFLRSKKFRDAILPLRRSAELHPGRKEIWSDLATALIEQGKFDEAKTAISSGVGAGIGGGLENYLLGVLHLKMARALFSESIRCEPGYIRSIEKVRALRSIT